MPRIGFRPGGEDQEHPSTKVPHMCTDLRRRRANQAIERKLVEAIAREYAAQSSAEAEEQALEPHSVRPRGMDQQAPV